MISLIAFLGNVGREYERTRHNAAWIAADHLNICAGISWQHKFRGLYGRFPAAVSGSCAQARNVYEPIRRSRGGSGAVLQNSPGGNTDRP